MSLWKRRIICSSTNLERNYQRDTKNVAFVTFPPQFVSSQTAFEFALLPLISNVDAVCGDTNGGGRRTTFLRPFLALQTFGLLKS